MSDVQKRLSALLADRYRIDRELGKGGMATVLLAYDLRHDRQVAIKVLHEDLGATLGPDRFLTEIKTTARLQHPHILPLIDSGEAQGLLYYVMPYVQGESLRDRLDREKQLPLEDALRITREIADALGFAHEQGIVHRDIKPENILLQGGHALVADFGIALAVQQAGGTRLTQTGLSLGTPHYMAPEQAMGDKSVDHRADVYSLGAVMYELLVGEPPFTGATVQAIVAKMMSERPVSPRTVRDTVPPHVESAVLKALAKLPADRFQTAGDFATALRHSESATEAPPTARMRGRSWRRVAVVGGVVAALAIATGWLALNRDRAATSSGVPSRLSLLTPFLGGSGGGLMHRQVTMLPDGSGVIYVGGPQSASADRGLSLQRLDQEEPTLILRTPLQFAPSVSPDGRTIAVRSGSGEVMRRSLDGGASDDAPLAPGFAYYAWHPDGSLWITRNPYLSLERVRPDSDSLEVMRASLEQGTWIQQIIDGGKSAIAVEGVSGTSAGSCVLLDLVSGQRTLVIPTQVSAARYTSGYLVFARLDGTLLAQRMDERSGRLTGEPVAIAADVSISGSGDAQFDVSSNGTVVYVPEQPRSLVLINRQGVSRLATDERRAFHMPRFSADGGRVLTDVASKDGRDAWVLDLEQTTLTRVTFDRDGHDASWLPGDTTIAYISSRTGTFGVYTARIGSGTPGDSLIVSAGLSFPAQWLPDGSAFIAVANNLQPGSNQDIAIVRNRGRGPIEPLLNTPFRENFPALSHDGKWLAFVSDASGKTEVYVRSFSGGEQVQLSQGGGDEPMWSRDGRELFYRSASEPEPTLVSVTVQTTQAGTMRILGRRTLFPTSEYLPATPHSNYDVSPDGQTFAFVRRNAASRIVVIQNLHALIARLNGSTAR